MRKLIVVMGAVGITLNAAYAGDKMTITKDNNSVDIMLTEVWKHDNSETNNPINFYAQYPMLTAPLLAVGNYLYIPKFKTTYPSAQELYVIDAKEGTVLSDGAVVISDDETIGLDRYMTFENMGKIVKKDQSEAAEYFFISAPNARITDTTYKTNKSSDPRISWYSLDFSNPTKPKATKVSEYSLFTKWDETTYSKYLNVMSWASFNVSYFTQETTYNDVTTLNKYYCLFANGLIDNAKLASTDNDLMSNRNSFSVDNFRFFVNNESFSLFNHKYYKSNKNYDSYRKKNQFQLLGDEIRTAGPLVANFSNESDGTTSKLYGPGWTKISTSTFDAFTLLETKKKIGGDAIAHFTCLDCHFLVYASEVADGSTKFQIVYLPSFTNEAPSFSSKQNLWEIEFEVTDYTTNGENITSVYVDPIVEDDEETAANIYLYAQGQGLGLFRLEKYNENLTTMVSDLSTEGNHVSWRVNNNVLNADKGAQDIVNIYNTLGACVLSSTDTHIDLSVLANGVYIAKCGADTYKFVVK